MPLLDHFRPPLSTARHWEGFHARWAAALADALNVNLLPAGYFAEAQIHVGGRVEVDVATQEGDPLATPGNGGGTATATVPARVWAPPAPALEMPAVFPDDLEVLVFNTEAGPTLVAAVELASPGNKDRAETRRAFAVKCASYLQQGIGLVIVDVVTNRHAQLHNEMVQLLGMGESFLLPSEPLYAAAYRPFRTSDAERIAVWPAALAVGETLPALPLWLDKGQCVQLDLETTYMEARRRSRM